MSKVECYIVGAMEVDKLAGTSNAVSNHFIYCNTGCYLLDYIQSEM